MSKIIASAAIRGAHKLVERAESDLAKAIEAKGKDEKIEYVGNRMLSDNKAEVETRVYTGTAPIILTYRLALIDGKWGVYEVNADGISMMQTFRDDYKEFLQAKSPAELLDELKKKVEEAKS